MLPMRETSMSSLSEPAMTKVTYVFEADDFLGDFDGLHYYPLTDYKEIEGLMGAVFDEEFEEWLNMVTAAIVTLDMKDPHNEPTSKEDYSYQWRGAYDKKKRILEGLANELRNTVCAFVAGEILKTTGHKSTVIEKVYFNRNTVFVQGWQPA